MTWNRPLVVGLWLGVACAPLRGGAAPSEPSTGGAPPPRFAHGMAYDAARDRVVVFGGATARVGAAPMLDDTWEWDGSLWQRIALPGPAPRAYAAMAFDPSRGVVVLNGGRDDSNGTFRDTWEYDGSTWKQVVEQGPVGRDHHAFVYDPVHRVLLTFGGWDGESTHDDLWQWDGQEWRLISVGGPPPRSAYGFAWDADRQTLLMYGGTNVDARHADLWEWDGRSWRLLTDPYANPNRNHFTMVYEASRRRMLTFGGLDRRYQAAGDTRVLFGNRFQVVGNQGPANRYNQGMVYVGPRASVLLFGGCDRPGGEYVPMGDAWLWDGEAWQKLDPAE